MSEEQSKAPKEGGEEATSGISSLVPEIYYDLIARVPAGSVLLICTAKAISGPIQTPSLSAPMWLGANSVPALTTATVFLVVAGLLGILISPFASGVRDLYWKRSWLLVTEKGPCRNVGHALKKAGYSAHPAEIKWATLKPSDLHGIDRWAYDYLMMHSATAKTLLPKLRAEADLCSYLAAALIMVPLVKVSIALIIFASGIGHAETLADLWSRPSWTAYISCWLIAGLLCASGAYRTRRLLLRMLSMLSVVVEGQERSQAAA